MSYDNTANENTSSIHYLFVDTETTGVPKNQYSDWSECRLIQLGMVVKNIHFGTVDERLYLVEYDGTNGTTQESYAIHGLSDDERKENGYSARYVCESFIDLARKCDVIVMHGTAFDLGVILRECMMNHIDFSCLIGKWIVDTKLSEQYIGYRQNLSTTVNRLNSNWQPDTHVDSGMHTHNALYDAHLCAELYRHSHYPGMSKHVEDVIGYLNLRGYADELIHANAADNISMHNSVNETSLDRYMEQYHKELYDSIEDKPCNENQPEFTEWTDEDDEMWYPYEEEEEEGLFEEDCMDESHCEEEELACEIILSGDSNMTMEDYIREGRNTEFDNGMILTYHPHEDYP